MQNTLKKLQLELASPDPVLKNEILFHILGNVGEAEGDIFRRDSRWGDNDNYADTADETDVDNIDLEALLNSATAAQAATGVRELFKEKNKQFMGIINFKYFLSDI